MFVGRWMTKKPVTVGPRETLLQAARVLSEHRIHRLPVVEEGRLVGIVSEKDLRRTAFEELDVKADGTPSILERTVSDVMVRDVVTVTPWDTVEDALLILHKKRLGGLPVVATGRRLVGIITKTDVLAAFIAALDIEGIGVRVEVSMPKELETVRRLLGTVGAMGIDVRSVVLAPLRGGYVAFLHLSTISVAEVKARLSEAGFTVPELEDFPG